MVVAIAMRGIPSPEQMVVLPSAHFYDLSSERPVYAWADHRVKRPLGVIWNARAFAVGDERMFASACL
jgi:hypothetical protein